MSQGNEQTDQASLTTAKEAQRWHTLMHARILSAPHIFSHTITGTEYRHLTPFFAPHFMPFIFRSSEPTGSPANEIHQVEVTQVPIFHVTVDTLPEFTWDTAQAGEKLVMLLLIC